MAAFSYENRTWIYSGELSWDTVFEQVLRLKQEAEINKLKQKGKKESNVSLLDRMCSIKEIEL